MSIRNATENVEILFEYARLKSRRDSQSEDINLGVLNTKWYKY